MHTFIVSASAAMVQQDNDAQPRLIGRLWSPSLGNESVKLDRCFHSIFMHCQPHAFYYGFGENLQSCDWTIIS
jgi:hypothetical protein